MFACGTGLGMAASCHEEMGTHGIPATSSAHLAGGGEMKAQSTTMAWRKCDAIVAPSPHPSPGDSGREILLYLL